MRDGSGVYTIPVGTLGVTDTTIESAKYNNFVSDVEHDLNWPRPIIAGGTGATNPRDALIALGGEAASQQVTNYDSFPFLPGSFYSAAGATGAPTAAAFTGIAYQIDANYMVLEATALGSGAGQPALTIPPVKYVRERWAGTWGSWLQADTRAINAIAAANLAKVDRAGDTMTGPLMIQMVNPTLSLSRTSAARASIGGRVGASARWERVLGSGDPEAGANAGSVFAISRYSDAGIFISNSLTIDRASNTLTAFGSANVNGALGVGTTLNVGGTSTFTGQMAINSVLNVASAVYSFGGKFIASNVSNPGFVAWNGSVGLGMYNISGTLTFAHGDNNGNFIDTLATISSVGTLALLGGLTTGGNVGIGGALSVTGTASFVAPVTIQATGGLSTIEPNGTVITQAGFAKTIFNSGTTGEPFVSFYKQGAFAQNFGMAADANFYAGGVSFTPNQFKFWTTRELTAPLKGTRLALAGDNSHLNSTPMAEPYAGAVVTGFAGINGSSTLFPRYRYLQVDIVGTGFVTVSYT